MRTFSPLAALTVFAAFSTVTWAQDAVDAETAAPPLPAAGSQAATKLLDTGIDKMLAVGRGMFRTTTTRDAATFRGADFPFAKNAPVVQGGWRQDFVWGDIDGAAFARHRGRTIARLGDTWKLRAERLADGRELPFVVDPELLFTVLRELPAAARAIAHVDRGTVGERRVTILTLSLTHDAAEDVAESGAIPPAVEPGLGGVFVFGGVLPKQPRAERELHVALHVDPDNGDVLQLGVKLYEKNPQFARVFAARAKAANDDDDEGEQKDVPTPPWQDGLPTREPAADESVLTFVVEFPKLGLAELPELDDHAKQLLRLR